MINGVELTQFQGGPGCSSGVGLLMELVFAEQSIYMGRRDTYLFPRVHAVLT